MSGNPSPQHNPTDGLGVAAYIQLSGSSGSSVVEAIGTAFSGQGKGASPSGTNPNAQYGLTLSVSGSGGYASSLAVTAALFDAKNNPYVPSDQDSWTAISYNDPSSGSPAWYRPSNYGSYSANIASVVAGGTSGSTNSATVTALNPGQAIIEIAFATFDNTLGNTAQPPADQPVMKIYQQIVVQVIP